MSRPVIKKSELVSLIQDKGYTRKDLAEHFKVSVQEINKYLKVLNLKLRAKKMTYEVIDDTVVTTETVSPLVEVNRLIANDENVSEEFRNIMNVQPIA
jgi:hypothetical protein